ARAGRSARVGGRRGGKDRRLLRRRLTTNNATLPCSPVLPEPREWAYPPDKAGGRRPTVFPATGTIAPSARGRRRCAALFGDTLPARKKSFQNITKCARLSSRASFPGAHAETGRPRNPPDARWPRDGGASF